MQTRRGQLVFTDILSGFSELYLSLHVGCKLLEFFYFVINGYLLRTLFTRYHSANRSSETHDIYTGICKFPFCIILTNRYFVTHEPR